MSGVQITRDFSSPWFAGQALTATTPWRWDVAINGTPFLVDTRPGYTGVSLFAHQSIPLLRAQNDSSTEPGQGSVNPESLWLRSKSSWHHGAGQVHADDDVEAADKFRFRSSKGVDVWTEHQLSLLPATDQKRTSANTNLKLMVAGARMYLIDGADCVFTTDGTVDSPTFTATTGEPGGTLLDIASDGFNVWITDGSTVSASTTGGTVFSSFSTEDIDVLGYVKGRLMGAEDNELFYNVAGTMTSLFQHPNTNFSWVGFSEGPAHIYAAGFSGDKSLVYKIGLRPDATGLDQPTVAGELPDGEIIRSIGSYLGNFVVLGTDKGWRFCLIDTQGNLRIGTTIATPAAVRCFEPQERFIWVGYTNYDATSTGLGRTDITQWGDQDRQQPAYASDLMCTAQGAVLSVVTFGSKRYYTVSASGVWGEDTLLVTSGSLDSGVFNYGLADIKVAIEMSVNYAASLAGSHEALLAVDGTTTFTSVGTTSIAGTSDVVFPVGERRSAQFEVRHTLTRDSVATTTGPTVRSWSLACQPAPKVRPMITVPLRIFQRMNDANNAETYLEDPGVTVAALKQLNETREVYTYQEGGQAYSCVMDGYEWHPEMQCDPPDKGWQGSFVCTQKVVG